VIEEWDSDVAQLFPHFQKCVDFINSAVEGGGNVLIHWCVDGRKRERQLDRRENNVLIN
jgi:hypothetical protein